MKSKRENRHGSEAPAPPRQNWSDWGDEPWDEDSDEMWGEEDASEVWWEEEANEVLDEVESQDQGQAPPDADAEEPDCERRGRIALLKWLADEATPHLRAAHHILVLQMLRHARRDGVFQIEAKQLAQQVEMNIQHVYRLRSELVRMGLIEQVPESVVFLWPRPYRFTPDKFRTLLRKKGSE